jgi:hypothetical protein
MWKIEIGNQVIVSDYGTLRLVAKAYRRKFGRRVWIGRSE